MKLFPIITSTIFSISGSNTEQWCCLWEMTSDFYNFLKFKSVLQIRNLKNSQVNKLRFHIVNILYLWCLNPSNSDSTLIDRSSLISNLSGKMPTDILISGLKFLMFQPSRLNFGLNLLRTVISNSCQGMIQICRDRID